MSVPQFSLEVKEAAIFGLLLENKWGLARHLSR
jgi:hypothetical protein